MWLCIGASGLRPCCLCRNILMEGADVSGDDYFRTPSTAAAADFDLHTAESIQDCIDQVASISIGPRPPGRSRVEEAHKIHGWKYDEHGILDDPYVLQFFTLRASPPAYPNAVTRRVALISGDKARMPSTKTQKIIMEKKNDVAKHTFWDFMHSCVGSGGVGPIQLGCFVGSLASTEAPITLKDLDDFASTVRLPSGGGRKRMGRTFFQDRAGAGYLKCFASEAIDAISVLWLLVLVKQLQCSDSLRREVHCLALLFEIVCHCTMLTDAELVSRVHRVEQVLEEYRQPAPGLYPATAKPKLHYVAVRCARRTGSSRWATFCGSRSPMGSWWGSAWASWSLAVVLRRPCGRGCQLRLWPLSAIRPMADFQ
ncbi:unnamed protein product [Prorocentrum cordatum]|uniref:Uncharacterized protein n=1 Tax=Prorocentrum cordatum TaxID=2364126 RepID=A0ABN9TWM2_9DINO|nr:unnamed protein product [Polarella glacialis]